MLSFARRKGCRGRNPFLSVEFRNVKAFISRQSRLIQLHFLRNAFIGLFVFAVTAAVPSLSQQPTATSGASAQLLVPGEEKHLRNVRQLTFCLLYTSDAADEEDSVDLG